MRRLLPPFLLLAALGAQDAGPGKPLVKAVEEHVGMTWIVGGEAMLGSQNGDRDAPLHRVKLDGFWIDTTEDTNAQFAE